MRLPARDFGEARIEERAVVMQQDDSFENPISESIDDRSGETQGRGAPGETAGLSSSEESTGAISRPRAEASRRPVESRSCAKPAHSRDDVESLLWVSDQELVEQILAGSREHFDLLYETYFPRVYRFALKRLSDPGEAEDVAQEVFMTLMTALASFKGESTLLVWIFGVTRNKVNRRFRRPRPRLEPLEEGGALDIAASGPLADEAVDARRMLGRCESVIENDLTPLQRRIFHLKHLRRQPIRAIAEALGKSEDAVKANLYRMRRAISEGTPGLESMLQN
jgi:RNA polymerase sigma-70 factor (ECF subfamily)